MNNQWNASARDWSLGMRFVGSDKLGGASVRDRAAVARQQCGTQFVVTRLQHVGVEEKRDLGSLVRGRQRERLRFESGLCVRQLQLNLCIGLRQVAKEERGEKLSAAVVV